MQDHLSHAKNIWAYLGADYTVKKSDFMLVLGSSDLSVANYASAFWFKNLAGYIVVSGGFGKLTKEMWAVSEARKFSQIMMGNGVPEEKIILEEKATNTGENIGNAKKLIADLGLPANSGILITKPYMKRRAFNTASKQWSEANWSVAAEAISFEDYLIRQDDPQNFISIMVGDLQRIKIYAESGFQIRDEVPQEVWESFEALVQLGYDRYLTE
ncbi:MAG: YdcF family protein [Lewinellaceae bacterium]|nr:YdcF family protein [Lewinellaceae bacterium]